MSVQDILFNLGSKPERLRKRLEEEISRLAERGLIASGEADELKARFQDEIDERTREGVAVVKGLGSGAGALIRELLDLPSRRELREFMELIEDRIDEVKQAPTMTPAQLPVHNPAQLKEPGRPMEILPGIHVWSKWSEDKGLFFNGHRIETPDGAVVTDPVDPGTDEARNAILDLGAPAAIVVLNRHHLRAAEWLRRATRAPIWMAEPEAEAVEVAVDRKLRDEDRVCGELRVIALPGKTPGEIALLREADGGQLIVGDTLIGRPAGALSLLPDDKLEDPRRLRRSLRNLIDERFDALLVGDGVSILSDADKIAHAFLRSL